MAFDTLIKKFFPAIIGAVVALIAYLQASGVVQLVAASALTPSEAELTAGSLRPKKMSRPPARVRKSAQPIIAHNVFDHETDLNPKPPEPEEEEVEKTPELNVSDPLRAEPCKGVIVHIVTESTDRNWSIAVLQGPGESKGTLRRVGDTVGDFQVEYIGYNWLEGSPAVWMTSQHQLCQAMLFGELQPESKSKPAAKQEAPKPAPKTSRRGAPKVPDEIADKIEKVSETEFNIDRAVVDNVLENQAQLMKSARIVPEKGADGKIVGIRLFGVRPDTLLGTLGLQNGDRLETINGFEMASPEKALEAYARLRTASKLAIKITRRGKPMNLDFNIK
jgi:general secretion pathway protein C